MGRVCESVDLILQMLPSPCLLLSGSALFHVRFISRYYSTPFAVKRTCVAQSGPTDPCQSW